MKRLPTEEKLLEILEIAKNAAEKAKKLRDGLQEKSEFRRRKREAKLVAQQQESGRENLYAKQ